MIPEETEEVVSCDHPEEHRPNNGPSPSAGLVLPVLVGAPLAGTKRSAQELCFAFVINGDPQLYRKLLQAPQNAAGKFAALVIANHR